MSVFSSPGRASNVTAPPDFKGKSCQVQEFPPSLENTSPRSDTTPIRWPFEETRTDCTGSEVSGPTGLSLQVAPQSVDTSNPPGVAAYHSFELKARSVTTSSRGAGPLLALPTDLRTPWETAAFASALPPITVPAGFQAFFPASYRIRPPRAKETHQASSGAA